jgi:hypothetical protein
MLLVVLVHQLLKICLDFQLNLQQLRELCKLLYFFAVKTDFDKLPLLKWDESLGASLRFEFRSFEQVVLSRLLNEASDIFDR